MARILSLESSAFTVSEEGDTYIFTVTGSGHLVGMSIAGADAMSQDGCGYRDILAHYYTGTEVKGWFMGSEKFIPANNSL